MNPAKRILDLFGATAGLALLLPAFTLTALLIKLDDGGPVFFRQVRVGRGGRTFRMWKFRTMVPDAERIGGYLTVGRDARVTRFGSWLRKTKLDELPQLLNVLAGEMSLVGPRPEVPRYVREYDVDQRRVLALCPGITDPASIRFRNESELLADSDDPDGTYIARIMPEKIRMNLEYARHATVWTDLRVILQTLIPPAGRGARPATQSRG